MQKLYKKQCDLWNLNKNFELVFLMLSQNYPLFAQTTLSNKLITHFNFLLLSIDHQICSFSYLGHLFNQYVIQNAWKASLTWKAYLKRGLHLRHKESIRCSGLLHVVPRIILPFQTPQKQLPHFFRILNFRRSCQARQRFKALIAIRVLVGQWCRGPQLGIRRVPHQLRNRLFEQGSRCWNSSSATKLALVFPFDQFFLSFGYYKNWISFLRNNYKHKTVQVLRAGNGTCSRAWATRGSVVNSQQWMIPRFYNLALIDGALEQGSTDEINTFWGPLVFLRSIKVQLIIRQDSPDIHFSTISDVTQPRFHNCWCLCRYMLTCNKKNNTFFPHFDQSRIQEPMYLWNFARRAATLQWCKNTLLRIESKSIFYWNFIIAIDTIPFGQNSPK